MPKEGEPFERSRVGGGELSLLKAKDIIMTSEVGQVRPDVFTPSATSRVSGIDRQGILILREEKVMRENTN